MYKDYEDPNQITMDEIDIPIPITMEEEEEHTHTITKEETEKSTPGPIKADIFRVTYGYYGHDSYGKPIYKSKVFVSKGRAPMGLIGDESLYYPVYAKLVNGRLKELFTGIEIPLPEDERIPGFGAYELKLVYSYEDYQHLELYLRLIRKDRGLYKSALLVQIKALESIKEEYLKTHGLTPKEYEERRKWTEREFGYCKRMVEQRIDDFGTKSM